MSADIDQLSDALRRLVRRGDLTHLSVICMDGVWKAVYRGTDDGTYRHADSEDVVNALLCAITGRRPKPIVIKKPKQRRKPQAAVEESFEDLV